MKLSIQAFTEFDYDAIGEIETVTWIDDAQNKPADIRHRDDILKADPSINFTRFVGITN